MGWCYRFRIRDMLRTALVLRFAHCNQQKASICSLPLCPTYLCQHLRAASLSYLPLPAPSCCLSVLPTFASTFALPLCRICLCQHLCAACLSYLSLPTSARCLSVIPTFASICSLPLCHNYLCQYLRAASLLYLPLPASARCLSVIHTFTLYWSWKPWRLQLTAQILVAGAPFAVRVRKPVRAPPGGCP